MEHSSGKEGFEFAIQLGCQSFVVAYNESGAIRLCYYVGDGKGFSGTCDSKESLCRYVLLKPCNKLIDGFRLIACWLVLAC